jgi:hypothetical protein
VAKPHLLERLNAVPALWRRREVWLPTWRGTLLLLALTALALGVLGHQAYDLLAIERPARGPAGDGARTLVVEGWLEPPQLRQAVAALRAGRYERVLTTGGPLPDWPGTSPAWHSHAERAAAFLRANGVTEPVIPVAAPATARDRTYLSAVMVREWAQRAGVRLDAIDLYSAGVHARRSSLVYRIALGDAVEVGVRSALPTEYDARRWWTSSTGAKTTIGEALSLAWTACCFWPPARGTPEERLEVPPAAP